LIILKDGYGYRDFGGEIWEAQESKAKTKDKRKKNQVSSIKFNYFVSKKEK
jgi:hypothetical protein